MQLEHRNSVLPRPHPGTAPVPSVPRPDRFALRNGLRVVAVQRNDLPQISARLIVPAGSVTDPEQAQGTASLVGALLTEGTGSLSAVELNERIDRLGAALCTRVGHDFAEIDLALLSETLDEGMQLLASIVSDAAFPAEEFERVRSEALDALESRLDEPANIADDRVALALFGPGHPYGRLPLGTIAGVERLERQRLIDFYHARFRPAGSLLIIAGDLDSGTLQSILETNFAGWTGRVDPACYPASLPGPIAPSRLIEVEWEDAAQAEVRMAGIGMGRDCEDWIAAAVANYILGGSTITGRLGANLREDKGWTYGVRSSFAAGREAAGWIIETAVDAAVSLDALHEIEREVRSIVEHPVSAEELERARESLILSLPRAFETAGRTVARLATVEAFGLEPDYWELFPERVRAVSAGDIEAVSAQYFAPEALVRIIVGPAREAQGEGV